LLGFLPQPGGCSFVKLLGFTCLTKDPHVPIKNPRSALDRLMVGESAVFAGEFAQTEGRGL